MERLTENGKIEVVFNGLVFANCSFDGDCPDQSTCIIGASWAAHNTMCTCTTQNSRFGDACEFLSSAGWGIFALYLVGFLLAAFASVLLGYDIYQLKKARTKINFSAIQTTLLFLEIAAISTQGYFLFGMIDQLSANVLVHRGSGENKRSSPIFVGSNVFLALTFFFETLGLLNISLCWVDIAYATKTMSHRTQHNIQRFRVGLAVYYFFFGGAVIVFVILDRMNLVTYVVIVPIFFLITSYIWGYFMMSRAAGSKSTGKSSEITGETKGSTSLLSANDQQKKGPTELKKALKAMANTALALVVFGSMGVLFLILQITLSSPNMNTPSLPISHLMNRLAWVCWAMCLIVGANYLHPLVLKQVNRSQLRVLDSKNDNGMLVSAPSSSHFIQQSVLAVQPYIPESAADAPVKKRSLVLTMSGNANEGMDVILNEENLELRERFTAFVRAKFASEPLHFYDACKRYKTKAVATPENAGLVTMGQQIIQDYVVENAPHAVDMAHSLRDSLMKSCSSKQFTVDTFDKAQAMALELLKVNFYHQFRKALEDEGEKAV